MPGAISHWILEIPPRWKQLQPIIGSPALRQHQIGQGHERPIAPHVNVIEASHAQRSATANPSQTSSSDTIRCFCWHVTVYCWCCCRKKAEKNFFFLLTNGIVLKKLVICTNHVQSLPRNLKDKDASVGPVPWWSTATPPLFEKRPAYREALKIVSRRPEESRHQVSWRPFPDPLSEILPPLAVSFCCCPKKPLWRSS